MRIKFYEDCLPVKGHNRSIIIDTTRKKLEAIPNSLFHFIKEADKFTVEEIKSEYSEEDRIIIDEYIDFLLDNEYAFFIDDLFINNFPKIELFWDYPAIISNAIIALKINNWKVLITKILPILNDINCQDIEIRFEDSIEENEIKELILLFEKSRICTITLIIPHLEITDKTYDLLSNNLRLEQIILYNTPILLQNNLSYKTNQIQITTKPLEEIFVLSSVSQLNPNLNLFMESQKKHTYFNRKLFFDTNGDIKNAPECDITIGNINNIANLDEFKLLLKNDNLEKYWHISKDDCDICKDCEFKNICIDNRLPIQRNDGTWYHSKECNYNPYISKWAGEKDYVTIKELGITSNENGFSLNKKNKH